jgi:hypothetical protein
MSPLCFLSQHPHERKTGAKLDCQANMSPHFDAVTGGHEAKKKERRRISGRPSSMSLSEEGSFVFCIAVRTGNRSTFFEGGPQKKNLKKSVSTLRPTVYAPNDGSNLGPRLPQRYFVSPTWGLPVTGLGGGQGEQSSRLPNA